MDLEKRLRVEYGEDCFSRVTSGVKTENEFRSAALWRHLCDIIGTDLPRSRATVIHTIKAFPHTRWTSQAVRLVFDQHLIAIFQTLTVPLSLPNCTQELASAHVGAVFSERLQLAGQYDNANLYSVAFPAVRDAFGELGKHRGAWSQADLLTRGQWLFAVAHELAHAILYRPGLASKFDRQLDQLQPDLIRELDAFSKIQTDDSLRRLPVLELFRRVHRMAPGSDESLGSTLKTRALHKLQDPLFRREVICDWLASRATAEEMYKLTSHEIGLAICGLSLMQLAVMKQLDSYAALTLDRTNQHTADGALRFVLLRALSHVNPLKSADSIEYYASHAFGDIAAAYTETYAEALEKKWYLLPR